MRASAILAGANSPDQNSVPSPQTQFWRVKLKYTETESVFGMAHVMIPLMARRALSRSLSLGLGRPAGVTSLRRARFFQTSAPLLHGHGHGHVDPNAADVALTFVTKDGDRIDVVGKEGQSLLDVARHNDVDLEGACEASIACSTCHVILTEDVFDMLEEGGEEATEEEDDMLDMAVGLTLTSRLGCQVLLSPDLEGTDVTLPAATRNFYVDGHVPEPH